MAKAAKAFGKSATTESLGEIRYAKIEDRDSVVAKAAKAFGDSANHRSVWRVSLPQPLPCLDVIAEQQILVADVELSVGNDRMSPSWCVAAIGLVKSPPFDKAFF